MPATVEAVYENGVLKLTQPARLRDGQKYLVQVPPDALVENDSEDTEEFLAALRAVQEEAAKLPPGFWDQFDRDLDESRKLVSDRLDLAG